MTNETTEGLLRSLVEQSKEATAAAQDAARAATRAADRVGVLEGKIESSRAASIQEHERTREELRREVHRLEAEIGAVKARVDGSQPPPPNAPPVAQAAAAAAATAATAGELAEAAGVRATGAGHELAALEGRMIAEIARIETAAKAREEERARVDAARAEELRAQLKAQDRALGVGRRGVAKLFSPPVLRTLPAIIAALGVLWAAVRGVPAAAPSPAPSVVGSSHVLSR